MKMYSQTIEVYISSQWYHTLMDSYIRGQDVHRTNELCKSSALSYV